MARLASSSTGENFMRLDIALVSAALTFAALAGSAHAAPSVEIRDAVLRVVVVPEDRADVKVEVTQANAQLPLTVRTSGDITVIDGDLDRRIRSCNGSKGVRVRDVGRVDAEDMPQIVIRTPRSVVLKSSGAVRGSIGRSGALDLRDSGCSAWTIADVAGPAFVRSSGAGDIRMGQASRLTIELSGAANIRATRAREALDARLSGAGNVQVEEVGPSMDARVSGVGSIRVADGQATAVRASVSGIGGVDFGGVASRLDASVSGMGHVDVKRVNGPVSKSVSGIGSVRVGS